MNKTLIKHIVILSLILGIIPGFLAPIPHLGMIMLVLVLLLSAPSVMVYSIMEGKLDLENYTKSIITGGIIGFCTSLSFSTVFTITTILLSVGFKYTSNMFLNAMLINSPIWLLVMFFIFIGVVFAVTNAFSALATNYVIEFIRDYYEKNQKGN